MAERLAFHGKERLRTARGMQKKTLRVPAEMPSSSMYVSDGPAKRAPGGSNANAHRRGLFPFILLFVSLMPQVCLVAVLGLGTARADDVLVRPAVASAASIPKITLPDLRSDAQVWRDVPNQSGGRRESQAQSSPLRRFTIPPNVDDVSTVSRGIRNARLSTFAPTSVMPRAFPHFNMAVFPVVGPRMSSKYGMRFHPILKFSRLHTGVDLAAPEGSFVRAVSDGVVVFADPYKGYGNLVVIAHHDGMTTHYGHLEKILSKPGKSVRAGDIIATVGTTGHSTGPHLHFEVRLNGDPQDPEKVADGMGDQADG